MLKNFDDIQKYGKDNMDVTMKAWGQLSKGVQAIAAETADYSKKSFEEGSAALEKLFGAKSLDKAIEIQSAYAKTAYEGFVAQATKMGELYADLAKEILQAFREFRRQERRSRPSNDAGDHGAIAAGSVPERGYERLSVHHGYRQHAFRKAFFAPVRHRGRAFLFGDRRNRATGRLTKHTRPELRSGQLAAASP